MKRDKKCERQREREREALETVVIQLSRTFHPRLECNLHACSCVVENLKYD